MKILEVEKMPDGTDIYLEDWSGLLRYETILIAAYPLARNTGRYEWVVGGKPFRLFLSGCSTCWKNDDEVRTAFSDLKEGRTRLKDYSDKFRYGNKDKWYLGMPVEYQGW